MRWLNRFSPSLRIHFFCSRSIIEFMSALKRQSYGLLLSFICLITACEPPNEVGVENFAEESFDLFPVDTLSIEWTTFREDSIITDLPERLLVGRGEDHIFGTIEARSFFQLGVDSVISIEEEDNVRYDSITLAFDLDGYAYFDTLRPITLSLYQISDDFEADEGYFNTTNFTLSLYL